MSIRQAVVGPGLRRLRTPEISIPPAWICPRPWQKNRTFSTSAAVEKNLPGKLKAARRRQVRLEGEKLRHQARELEKLALVNPKAAHQAASLQIGQESLAALADAIESNDVIDAFKHLEEAKACRNVLGFDVTVTECVRLLHYSIRSKSIQRTEGEELCLRFEQLYRRRLLPGHPRSTMHLMAAYRDMGKFEAAADLWDWARKQRDSADIGTSRRDRYNRGPEIPGQYVDLRTYGIALEILPRAGRNREESEEVYAEALQRFPMGFNEYHLSPAAALPEPDLPTNNPGMSINLLSGIMTSRFIHGDWRSAFLTLDTSMRLHPTQIPISLVTQLSRERPLSEQYQVLCMLLQGGSTQSPAYLSSVLTDMGSWLRMCEEPTLKVDLLLAMLDLIHLAHTAGMTLDAPHLNIFALAAINALPMIRSNIDRLQEAEARLLVEVLSLYNALNLTTPTEILRQIVIEASFRKARGVVKVVESLMPEPQECTEAELAVLMYVHGALGDNAKLMEVWDHHSLPFKVGQTRADEDPKSLSWRHLIAALVDSELHHADAQTRITDLVQREMADTGVAEDDRKKFMTYLLRTLREQNKAHQERQSWESKANTSGAEGAAVKAMQGVNAVADQLHAAREAIDQGGDYNLDQRPMSRTSIFAQTAIPVDWQRDLYDELVLVKPGGLAPTNDDEGTKQPLSSSLGESQDTDSGLDTRSAAVAPPYSATARGSADAHADAHRPSNASEDVPVQQQQAPNLGSPRLAHTDAPAAHISPTSIPLATLRFRNWCAMNQLMMEVAAFEEITVQGVEKAVDEGRPMMRVRSTYGVKTRNARLDVLKRQLDIYRQVLDKARSRSMDRDSWQQWVLKLRTGSTERAISPFQAPIYKVEDDDEIDYGKSYFATEDEGSVVGSDSADGKAIG